MPLSKDPPEFWGAARPAHWNAGALFTWMLSNAELRGKTLAQCGQDIFVQKICATLLQEKKPLYLDIGANEGSNGSSTQFLEMAGWTGLMVEPNPYLFRKISSSRKDPILCAAVSDTPGVDVLVTGRRSHKLGTLMSHFIGYQKNRLEEEVNITTSDTIVSLVVPSVTLISLLKFFESYFGALPDFLKVDAEGCETEIVTALASTESRPLLIEVENNQRQEHAALILSSMGYRCIIVMDSFVEIWINTDEGILIGHEYLKSIVPH